MIHCRFQVPLVGTVWHGDAFGECEVAETQVKSANVSGIGVSSEIAHKIDRIENSAGKGGSACGANASDECKRRRIDIVFADAIPAEIAKQVGRVNHGTTEGALRESSSRNA